LPKMQPDNDVRSHMDPDEILRAAQEELMKHDWNTFCTQPLSIAEGSEGVIMRGCVKCRVLLYPNNQYLSYLAIDVVARILEGVIIGSKQELAI
jgi:hypothetical protein